jgi:hypothetical protein
MGTQTHTSRQITPEAAARAIWAGGLWCLYLDGTRMACVERTNLTHVVVVVAAGAFAADSEPIAMFTGSVRTAKMGTRRSFLQAFSTMEQSTAVSNSSVTNEPMESLLIRGRMVNLAFEKLSSPVCVSAIHLSSSTHTRPIWLSKPAFHALSVSACTSMRSIDSSHDDCTWQPIGTCSLVGRVEWISPEREARGADKPLPLLPLPLLEDAAACTAGGFGQPRESSSKKTQSSSFWSGGYTLRVCCVKAWMASAPCLKERLTNTHRCSPSSAQCTSTVSARPLMLLSPTRELSPARSCTRRLRRPHCSSNGGSSTPPLGGDADAERRLRSPICAVRPRSGGSVSGRTSKSWAIAWRPPRGSSRLNSQPASSRRRRAVLPPPRWR